MSSSGTLSHTIMGLNERDYMIVMLESSQFDYPSVIPSHSNFTVEL